MSEQNTLSIFDVLSDFVRSAPTGEAFRLAYQPNFVCLQCPKSRSGSDVLVDIIHWIKDLDLDHVAQTVVSESTTHINRRPKGIDPDAFFFGNATVIESNLFLVIEVDDAQQIEFKLTFDEDFK